VTIVGSQYLRHHCHVHWFRIQQVTPKEYLESALAPLPGNDRGTASKNGIRESIKALFPERECFALVRPVSDEKQLQALDSVPASQLRPEFRQVRVRPRLLLTMLSVVLCTCTAVGQLCGMAGDLLAHDEYDSPLSKSGTEHSAVVTRDRPSPLQSASMACRRRHHHAHSPAVAQGLERLTALMFSKAQPKRLGQDVVSGGVLAALASAYVDAINGGAVPTIATAWQVRAFSPNAAVIVPVGPSYLSSKDPADRHCSGCSCPPAPVSADPMSLPRRWPQGTVLPSFVCEPRDSGTATADAAMEPHCRNDYCCL